MSEAFRNALTAAALAVCFAASAAYAQNFPVGQVRIIVPFPPGGATDVLARAISGPLQTLWGQTVVVDYRPGAAGVIGTRQVVTAPPDGHTLLLASTGAILALAASQSGGEPIDVARELAPVTLVAAPPYILVVNPSLPVHSSAELIALARRNPGKLTYGSSGAGSASHLSGALFQHMTSVLLLHVPYKGTGPAVTDLLGGRIDMMFSPALTVTPHIATGTLRVVGTTGSTRSALFPEYPTVAENGLAGYESLGWFGLFAPAATDHAVVAKIGRDVREALLLPEAKRRLNEQGAEPTPQEPEVFRRFVNGEIAKWLELAHRAGIRLGAN